MQRQSGFGTDLRLCRWFHGAGPLQGSPSALTPGQRDQSPFISTPACQEGPARPGTRPETHTAGDTHDRRHTWTPGGFAAGPPTEARGGWRRPVQAEPTTSWERSYRHAALPAAGPASSPVSALCSLALDLIPYNTWDLSLSLSCAFKETPLFISFLLLFIITKSF